MFIGIVCVCWGLCERALASKSRVVAVVKKPWWFAGAVRMC